MLDQQFTFDSLDYNLKLKRDNDWSVSRKRLLIILQTVDSADLKSGVIASTPVLVNCIKYARREARLWGDLPEYAFAVANFNDSKSFHLKDSARRDVERSFKTRVQNLIEKLNPTHILFSGDASLLYPITHANLKNGWVHKIDKRRVTSTLDLARLCEKDGLYANLLGFFCRDLANLMLGEHPYSIAGLVNKPKYVGDIKMFERMMKLFDKSEYIALDTETRNLSVYHNKIYTVQLCFDSNPEIGFVIPIDHPKSPFTQDERKQIKSALRERLKKKDNKFVMFNGMFDLRILRTCLRMLIIKSPVWEITAGEHLLDENVSSLSSLGIKGGNLSATLIRYGNDHYLNAKFGKEDRGTTGNVEPNDPDFLEYASMDVVCLLHIKAKQIERASKRKIAEQNYKPYFIRHMLYQMSDTAHQLSQLRQDGSLISKPYLRSLMAEGSILDKEIHRLLEEMYLHPDVQEANKQLLGDSGFKAKSLFSKASSAAQWVMNLGKTEHKRKLFFEVLGLSPISKTKSGADAIDKNYIQHYKDKNLVVAMFGDYQEAAKLLSTYVKGWYKRIRSDLDAAIDSYLRPDYTFFDVDTGRLASKNPNLQNIPARGKLAKIIKAMFRAPKGYLLIRFDYSAHEVRGWSIVSNDMVLANVFRMGQKLRQQWIKNPTPENAAAIKKDGDVHLLNVKRFFNKVVDKSHPLRDAVKAVVFGVIYGKGPRTLGEDTKKTEIMDCRAALNKLYTALRDGDKSARAEIDKVEAKLLEVMEEDRSEYAQGIMDKLFEEFKKGKQWIDRMSKLAEEQFYVYSPIGRIRFMPAGLTGDKGIIAKQVRRGTNAPVQGFASEIGTKASRRIMESFYDDIPQLKKMLGLEFKSIEDYRVFFNRIVHDASYFAVPFDLVIPFVHVLQWEATYGITKAYEDEFGIKFTIEPEIEMEFSARDDHSFKWDWSLPNIVDSIGKAVADLEEMKELDGTKEEVMARIFRPWKNPKARIFLQSKYPLLNVTDLDDEINAAIRSIV